MLQHISFSVPAVVLFSGAAFILYFLLQFILDPLRDIPGPFLARFTRLWYFIEIYKGSFQLTEIDLHNKYGSIVRIAPHEYSIDDVDAAKTIYGLGNPFPKSRWYWSWMPPDPEKASLFADLNSTRHGTQRRKFASSFSMSSIVGYEQFVNNCTSLLAQRFSEIARVGQAIDMQRWLQCYAFDVIGEITFSNRFGFLDMGEDKDGIIHAIDDKGFYSTLAGVFPWCHEWIYPYLPKTGGHIYVLNYTMKQMVGRQKALKDPKNAGREGPPDIMTKLVKAHEDNPNKVTKTDIFTMCQSNIGAGSDTTSITLSSIFYHLMTHPQSYQRLQEEIDTATQEGRISDPITFHQAQQLPYLQAVIKEALRIHPATGLPMSRVVPPQGTTIAGRFIPGGSTVGINAWVAHRNTSIYGADADSWRPERWLEIEEQGRGAEVERYFFAFGMGSRTCIGKNISLLEMSKLVPQLFRRFDFELEEGVPRDRLAGLNRWFVKQVGFRGRVYARGEK